MSMLRVAIVGCGQIADAHIEQIEKINNAEVVALCDLSAIMLEQAAMRYGITKTYQDLETMLEDVKPDVVHITTPPQAHYILAKTVLERGVHVQVEKPFTVHYEQAQELLELAKQKSLRICVTHSNAFDPSYLALKKAVELDQLGDIIHIEANMGYNLSGPFGAVFMSDPNHWLHQLPGGVYQNNLSHPLSMVVGLLKDTVTEVRATGYRLRSKRYYDIRDQLVDELRVQLITPTTTANISFSCHARPIQLNLSVQGSKQLGVASIDARSFSTYAGSSLPGPFAKLGWSKQQLKQGRKNYFHNIKQLMMSRMHYFKGMENLFSEFYDHILGNDKSPMSAHEILEVSRIMQEIINQAPEFDIDENNEEIA